MLEPRPSRFLVRRDRTETKWMVWDRKLKRPARFEGEELVRLSLCATEHLRNILIAAKGALTSHSCAPTEQKTKSSTIGVANGASQRRPVARIAARPGLRRSRH